MDENATLQSYFKHHLLAMHLLALTIPATAPIASAEIDSLRRVLTWTDGLHAMLARKLSQLELLAPDRVVVAHDWGGSWRPAEPKEHAVILVSEILGGFERINEYVHVRLAHEAWPAPTLEQSLFRVEARERCRAGIKGIARSCRYWLGAPRRHAALADLLHDASTIPGWVGLALGRCGDGGGPLAQADELTIAEVELIVKGLRIASFSRASLAVPLREMERGLQELRRAAREGVGREEEGV